MPNWKSPVNMHFHSPSIAPLISFQNAPLYTTTGPTGTLSFYIPSDSLVSNQYTIRSTDWGLQVVHAPVDTYATFFNRTQQISHHISLVLFCSLYNLDTITWILARHTLIQLQQHHFQMHNRMESHLLPLPHPHRLSILQSQQYMMWLIIWRQDNNSSSQHYGISLVINPDMTSSLTKFSTKAEVDTYKAANCKSLESVGNLQFSVS